MKLNFWQWLGVVLLVVGLTWLIFARRDRATTAPPTDAPVTTAPTP